MASLSKLRTAIKNTAIYEYSRHIALPISSSCSYELVELRLKKKKLLVYSPVRINRGSLSVFSLVRNMLSDASVYEEAYRDYSMWIFLLSLEPTDKSKQLFETVSSNSKALQGLLGSSRYFNMISLINEINGWTNEI